MRNLLKCIFYVYMNILNYAERPNFEFFGTQIFLFYKFITTVIQRFAEKEPVSLQNLVSIVTVR